MQYMTFTHSIGGERQKRKEYDLKEMPLKLMYITNNKDVALIAEKHGVDRIWIDLETKGKAERQKGRNTVKSNHTVKDIRMIKPFLSTSQLLVRINPWDKESKKEVEEVISAGADIIMLPMWRSVGEVKNFIDVVNGRCKTLLLLETVEAEKCLDEILTIQGVDEIHIGMNDLHSEYKLTYMFELLVNGKIEEICNKIRNSGIPYGFGGIGIIGTNLHPTPEEIVLEHYRLGSTGVILSRSFCNYEEVKDFERIDQIFSVGLKAMREQEKKAAIATEDIYEQNIKDIAKDVAIMVDQIKNAVK